MAIELFAFLINTYGYLGIFLVSFISSAAMFFPLSSSVFSIITGSYLDPFLVGLIAGIGAAIGELVGYGIGITGGLILRRTNKQNIRLLDRIKKWFQNHGGFFAIIIFAATPLPDYILGIMCGAVKYDIKKFFLATLIGKIIMNMVLAYTGLYWLSFMRSFLNGF